MMLSNGGQMPIIVSDKLELRRCVMHLWPNYAGIGLNIKPSKPINKQAMPHVVKDVDIDSPAQYAGVLNNDFILKVGEKLVEHEKFDTLLKLIKEQLKKERRVDLLLVNAAYYPDFKKRNEGEVPSPGSKKMDYSSPRVLAQVKYYESPLYNPNAGTNATGTMVGGAPVSGNTTLRSIQNTATLNRFVSIYSELGQIYKFSGNAKQKKISQFQSNCQKS
jgi:hypothetical protein